MANHVIHHRPGVSSFDWESAGAILIENNGYASAAWPAANEAILVPFRIANPVIARMMFCSNGATVSGNVDAGIYTKDGRLLVSIGGVAQSGTSSIQSFDIADTFLSGPDWFYMALSLDNTTGTFIRNSSNSRDWQRFGLGSMTSAYPLPASGTLAAPSRNYMPEFGIVFQTVV